MINTTRDYRQAIMKNRRFRLQDRIIAEDGQEITLSMQDVMSYSINEATSASGKFELGAAIAKEYKISLNNMDGKFDDFHFESADIFAKIGLCLPNGKWEDLQKGEFRIVEAKEKELTIDIKAYDGMLFFDRPYNESTLGYPATINQIITDACVRCQMTLNAKSVQMGDYEVESRPDAAALTFRDIISFCAQIMGCYAFINHVGQLDFGWYEFGTVGDNGLDGGIFDRGMPYVSGDSADGGQFEPWDVGIITDSGTTADIDYHHIYLLKSKSISTNSITITGITMSFKDDSSDETETLLYGKEGYVLEIYDNPLIQKETAQKVLRHVGEKVVGNTFWVFNVTTQSDPSIEAGDFVIVTDRRQKSYRTVITNTTFNLNGAQKIECGAETSTEKNYTHYGAVTKLMSAAGEQTEQKLSAYDIAAKQFSSLMTRSMGLYETYETLEDGSIIKYQHDKPNLSESKTIWRQNGNAFGVSTDGGKTWNAGTDAEGNAIYNVLSVVGFYFDWAMGGNLTLGGYNNTNGKMQILDAGGNTTGSWTKDGLVTNKAVLTDNIKLTKTYDSMNYEVEYETFKTALFTEDLTNRLGYTLRTTTKWLSSTLTGAIHISPGIPYRNNMAGTPNLVRNGYNLICFDNPLYLAYNMTNENDYSARPILMMDYCSFNFMFKTRKKNGITWESTPLLITRGAGTSTEPGEPYAVIKLSGNYITISASAEEQGLSITGNLRSSFSGSANVCINSHNKQWEMISSSSKRYKKVKRNMTDKDVDILYNIQPVIAKYKKGYLVEDDRRNGVYYPMFIAEDIEKYFPDAVDYNEKEEVENWNERVMIPAMFQMIKNQKEVIDNLEKRLEQLENLLLKGEG